MEGSSRASRARSAIWLLGLGAAGLGAAMLYAEVGIEDRSPESSVRTLVVHVSPETQKKTPVFRRDGSTATVYFTGMTIDADGAPNAYHPDGAPGLDALENAGADGKWWGVAQDGDGEPIIQESGQYKGYYVSSTWLTREDDFYPAGDPRHYVDSRTVPYIAIPRTVWEAAGVERGDLAYVFNLKNGKSSVAIVADWGTEDTLGEGSIALAQALGFASSNPRTGGEDDGIAYVVFPDSESKPRWPRDLDEMRSAGESLLRSFGGREAVESIRETALTKFNANHQ